MPKAYVRLPLSGGSRLIFPKFCPFTGSANPRQLVPVRHPRFGLRIPIPILGSIWANRTTRIYFPASYIIAAIDILMAAIGILIWLLLFLTRFFGSMFAAQSDEVTRIAGRSGQSDGIYFLKAALIVLGIFIACKIIRIINLRAVKIISVDGYSAEVCFKDENYARKLCALNELVCHDRPFKVRQAERERSIR